MSAPIGSYPLDIRYEQMIYPIEVYHLRSPESVLSSLHIEVEYSTINPRPAMVTAGSDTDIISIAISYIPGIHIGPALCIQHPPTAVFFIPDYDRIGHSVINRISVKRSRSSLFHLFGISTRHLCGYEPAACQQA